MKKYSFLLILLVLPILLSAQPSLNRSINKFYRSHKKDAGAVNIALPGWLLRVGALFVSGGDADEETKAALKYVKHIKKMKVLVMEDGHRVTKEESKQFLRQIQGKGMNELITIRDKEMSVNIMVKEKKDVIRKLMIFVRSDEELIMVNLKTKISMDQINDLIKEMIGPEVFKKVEEKSAPKIPQA